MWFVPPLVDNVVDNDEDARSGVSNPSETLRMAGIGLANLMRNLAYPGQTSSLTGMSLADLSSAQKNI